MILINPRVGNLVTGYDRICRIDRTLPSQWRNRLLVAYARRWQTYTQALAHSSRIFRYGLIFAAIFILLALGCGVFGYANAAALEDQVSIYRWAIFFGVIGLILGGLTLAYWANYLYRNRPQLPRHPRDADLFAPLLPAWREQLRGTFPAIEPNDYGAQAEQDFLTQLLDLENSFALYRLQQRTNEDADVIVVGPKGIWVFEVKHWQGKISYRNGKWERDDRIVYDSGGGIRERKPRPVTQGPDELWRRESGDIAITLQRRARTVITRLPEITRINGGIVFTHDDATYSIGGLSIPWDKPINWKRKLQDAPDLPGMDERTCLQVIDALLFWCQEVTERSATISMDRHAKELAQSAEEKLAQWIDTQAHEPLVPPPERRRRRKRNAGASSASPSDLA